ncbi:MAG: flagellar basal body P-ring formation chaperone FlgA [Cyanobacteria bacterium]|nr:flagellar basal body P-ring formation chaperone FlgA [Cyanobacteriota bacterium]MDA1019978.1 flagellar basal body P-ring formation chaperone FlgA [Cyanobacteriota bacterium]
MLKLLLLLILTIQLPIQAEPNNFATGSFWMPVKVKLTNYLNQKIDKKQYKYEIIGPTRELKAYMGNRIDADIKFEKLVFDTPSPRKTIIAYVEDASGKRIDSAVIQLEIWVYKSVNMLRKAVSRGQELEPNNIYQSSYPIRQMDEKLYFQGNLRQKVATSNIPANSPIKINMVRHQKLVQVGDMIKVTSGNSVINLEFFCKAMNSGDIGEIINLTCPEMSKKNHRAELTAAGEARLL